nr:DNA cytosine methyltransferase [Prevotella sp.]
MGFTVSSKVLWASDYGVPQNRNRFFLIGNKNGISVWKDCHLFRPNLHGC